MSTTYATSRGVHVDAGVDRVLVDGRDVTWFRATGMGPFQPMKVPSYQLTEPFGYGPSGALVIPRTNSNFEAPGTGDLAWARAGAPVLYQRVYGSTVVTDYRGVVIAVRTSGRELSLDVGGEVSAKAALRDRQVPVVRLLKDVGHWTQLAMQELNIPVNPPLGPVTGLNVPDGGGMTHQAWLEQLGPLSQARSGAQRAVMPETWGGSTYRFNVKQTTNKHMTIFADGDRITLDLVNDAAEQPTTFFGSGVDVNGVRWKNARYPGYFDGDPAPYPFTDDRDFGLGTTDSDTDTGDGITVLRINLLSFGYLDLGESPDAAYTQAMYDAVQELKHDAGLSNNGTMTPNAWDALFNIGVTGYASAGATVFPLFQDARVRKWNYSSDGSIIGRNPAYDPTVLDVHRTFDFGPGISKKQARDYVRGLWTKQQSQENWAGIITLNTVSVFSGEHDAADYDSLTADDLLPARNIRPGQNSWVPYFAGGVLFHIASVDVSEADAMGNRTVRLAVDTQARDHLELSETLARRRESRRDIRREWMAANRPTKASGAMVSSDELFGILPNDVALIGGQWNRVNMVMGQHGQVNSVDLRVLGDLSLEDRTGYVVVVVAAVWSNAQLQHFLGDPYPVDDDGGTIWDSPSVASLIERKVVLYATGTQLQPCGYWPKKHTNDNGVTTSADINGRWRDDSPWAYICAPNVPAVVTLGIYPATDGVLKAGHLFRNQEDDAV